MGVLLACASLGVRAAHAREDRACERCDPAITVQQARDAMDRAVAFRLPSGDPALPDALPWVLRAWSDAELGLGSRAAPLSRQAAARCLLTGGPGCGDALLLVAEQTLLERAGDADGEQLALAYLELVPWHSLSRARCVEGVVLRYRLSERFVPRRARAAWADACGPLGEGGEVGYRAAKAALLRGELAEAERRLALLARAGSQHVVRARYLEAVVRVAQNRPEAAIAAFAAVLQLPVEGRRSPAEDDARMLAALQLARLARDAGDRELAQELYSAVPPFSLGRAEALLEGAVVAGQRGDFGRVRLYLDALEQYRPQIRQQLAAVRLRANVAVVDGEELTARATFRELTRIGRDVRARWLTGSPAEVGARLRLDPTLGGLLDEEKVRELLTLQDDLTWAREELAAGEARLVALRAALDDGAFATDLDAAIEELEAASALLRQAEPLIGARERAGSKRLAGPAEAALALAREAGQVRSEIAFHLDRLRRARARRRARIEERAQGVAQELARTRAQLQTVEPVLREDMARLESMLVARADEVAEDLELAEEVGELELRWRAKQRATLEVARVRKEYDEEKLELATSTDRGQARVEQGD